MRKWIGVFFLSCLYWMLRYFGTNSEELTVIIVGQVILIFGNA